MWSHPLVSLGVKLVPKDQVARSNLRTTDGPRKKNLSQRLDKIENQKICLEQALSHVTHDLQKSPLRTVDSDDATYLKGLEVTANIRKGLSGFQRDFIDGIMKGRIESKIESVKSSKFVTFIVADYLFSNYAQLVIKKAINSFRQKHIQSTSSDDPQEEAVS